MSRRTAEEPVEYCQLATRIPKTLAREVKLHCLKTERQMQYFVRDALEERLAQKTRPKRRASAETSAAEQA